MLMFRFSKLANELTFTPLLPLPLTPPGLSIGVGALGGEDGAGCCWGISWVLSCSTRCWSTPAGRGDGSNCWSWASDEGSGKGELNDEDDEDKDDDDDELGLGDAGPLPPEMAAR
jgi:hypothetical protein